MRQHYLAWLNVSPGDLEARRDCAVNIVVTNPGKFISNGDGKYVFREGQERKPIKVPEDCFVQKSSPDASLTAVGLGLIACLTTMFGGLLLFHRASKNRPHVNHRYPAYSPSAHYQNGPPSSSSDATTSKTEVGFVIDGHYTRGNGELNLSESQKWGVATVFASMGIPVVANDVTRTLDGRVVFKMALPHEGLGEWRAREIMKGWGGPYAEAARAFLRVVVPEIGPNEEIEIRYVRD